MEGTGAMIGSASPEDPSMTSLGKAHGPDGGTQPKEVRWKLTGLFVLLSAFEVGDMLSLLRSPLWQTAQSGIFRRRLQTWAGAEPNSANGSETLGNCPEGSVV